MGQISDEQIDYLVTRGELTPDTANSLKAQRVGQNIRDEQNIAEEQAQAGRVAAIQDDRVQQNVNDIEALAMEGTGIQPGNKPIITPAPQPPGYAPAPVQDTPPASVPAEPSPEIQVQEMDQAQRKAARANAEASLANQVQTQVSQEQQKVNSDLAEKSKADTQTVSKDLNSDSSWGTTIRQAVAIMMGAYSQGLTGAKTNPVMDMLEKQIEAKARAHQWSEEQKLKAVEQGQKAAMFELDMQGKRTSNALALQNIEKAKQDIQLGVAQTEKAYQDVAQQKAMQGMAAKKQWTNDEVGQIPLTPEGDKLRSRMLVIGTDAKGNQISAPARDLETAKKLKETILPDLEKSKVLLNELVDLNQYFGNNPMKKVFDYNKVKQSEVDQRMLIGAMRLAIFGPGVLTDTEQKLADRVLVNPANLMSLASSNEAALVSILDKLQFIKNNALRQEGIEIPKTTNEINVDKIKAKYPKAREADIIDKLRRDKQWVHGE